MSCILAKDKAEKIREFEENFVYVSRSGEIRNIVVKTFWTKRGRKKILRDLKRRLRRILEGYDCSYQITLTYRDYSDYVKGDIKRFLNSFSRMFRYRGVSFAYFWVAEMQKRGMIHYHILFFVRLKDRRKVFDLFDKERIERLWRKGYTFITFSRQTFKKAYNYAIKYLLKTIRRENDFYLELVLFFREAFGSFRLFGMTQIRRFRRGVRKKLVKETEEALEHCYSPEAKEYFESKGLDWVLRHTNYRAERRTGRIVRRYCYWEAPSCFRFVEECISWVEMEELVLEEFFNEELFEFDF